MQTDRNIYAIKTGADDAYILLFSSEDFVIVGDGNGNLHSIVPGASTLHREELLAFFYKYTPLRMARINGTSFELMNDNRNQFIRGTTDHVLPKCVRKLLQLFWHYNASPQKDTSQIRKIILKAFQVRSNFGASGVCGYAAFDELTSTWFVYNIHMY